MIDLAAEKEALDIGGITRLQRLKTGALICFAGEAGAILGKAPGRSFAARCTATPRHWASPSR